MNATNTSLHAPLLDDIDGPAFNIRNTDGQSPVVLACEHASNRIPRRLNDLGLTQSELATHVAWDLGAAALARKLSDAFGAVLIEARFSRLVYDCNRPPDAPSAMPDVTEVCPIPGNTTLSDDERSARTREIYEPFHAAVSQELGRRQNPVLVTVHSFTPVFYGKRRDVEIGLLHAEDSRVALAMMQNMQGSHYDIRLNAPYGPEDGVLHSIEKHLTEKVVPYVMIEIRNDLLATETGIADISALLCRSIADTGISQPLSIDNPEVPNAP